MSNVLKDSPMYNLKDSPMYNRWQDQALLEDPQTRRRDLGLILRSLQDFISGFRALHFVGPCVTVFGSARGASAINCCYPALVSF